MLLIVKFSDAFIYACCSCALPNSAVCRLHNSFRAVRESLSVLLCYVAAMIVSHCNYSFDEYIPPLQLSPREILSTDVPFNEKEK